MCFDQAHKILKTANALFRIVIRMIIQKLKAIQALTILLFFI